MKKITSIAAVLAALLLGQSTVMSQTNQPAISGTLGATNALSIPQANPWSYSISSILMSRYYGTIFGGIFYDGPMSFTDFVASRADHLGVFTVDLSLGQKLDRLDAYNKDGGTEYDLTLDHSFKFGSKAYPVLVDAGVCYLALTDLKKTSDDAFEEFVRLDLPIRADRANGPVFTPYAEAFHYHLGDGLRDKGWFFYGGVYWDQDLHGKLFGNELKLNFDYRLGYCAGAYRGHPGVEYHRLSLSLPMSKGKWTFIPAIVGQLRGGPEQTFSKKDDVYLTFFIKRKF